MAVGSCVHTGTSSICVALHPGQQQAIAVQQLLAALKHDGKNSPQVSLACSLARGNPTVANITLALTITEAALTASRAQEREGKCEKWHAWLSEQARRGSGAVYRWIRWAEEGASLDS